MLRLVRAFTKREKVGGEGGGEGGREGGGEGRMDGGGLADVVSKRCRFSWHYTLPTSSSSPPPSAPKVIKFDGCYHGHADGFLVQAGSGVATLGLPDSPGVPQVRGREGGAKGGAEGGTGMTFLYS